MEIVEKDLPQLIVALDSLNDDANYVHILDAKENTNYYCPCCRGIVNPRAYKKDKDYQVQAHYYHETGGCSEETFVHYICKTWLFEKGCKFIVNNIQYEVKNIDVEKTLHTSFGDYRPDIIVITTVGKVFYFEIKITNKKTELYAPKWDELGNDVVEVDARYFINQKYNNDIPVFNLIYSDGECFIKSYSRNDYEDTIAKRKLEWKRQDKLNYKIQWERLDWFWKYLQDYKNNIGTKYDVLNTFKELDFYDMGICWDIVFSKSQCLKSLKDDIREIINDKSKNEFNKFVSEKEEKYKDVIHFYASNCKEKDTISLKWMFKDEYSLFDQNVHDSIYMSNKKWILHPNTILSFKEKFNDKEEYISVHIKNVTVIKKWMESNIFIANSMLLKESKDISLSYYSFNFDKNYITDIDGTIEKITKVFQDKIFDYFINNIASIRKDDVINILDEYFNRLSICDMLNTNYCNFTYSVKYKGFNIAKIVFDNTLITIGDTRIDYCLYKYENLVNTIKTLLDNELKNIDFLLCNTDFVIDLSRYSNNTWNFKYNEETDSIEVALSYLVPYLNDYSERITISKIVNVPHNMFNNVSIFEYKNIAIKILNKYIAPVMQQMLNEEIEKYNMTHLTSIAYKYSEVKK